MFVVTPVTGTPGNPLAGVVSIIDQFGNEHVIKGLQFRFVGAAGPTKG